MGLKHIAIDSMILIYLLEGHPKYKESCKKLIKNAESVVISSLSVGEILTGYKKNDNKSAEIQFFAFLKAIPNLRIQAFSMQEALHFANLRADYPFLKAPDAINIASALNSPAEVFITNDKELQKVTHVPVKTL